tara:strand:+ start:476 stop:715 length:240 start_codon:yes stop_codon:yes gene_type:complete
MIKMYIEAIDSYGKGSHYTFHTVAEARKRFKYHFGDKFESGGSYFVSWDGVVTCTIDAPKDVVQQIIQKEMDGQSSQET